MGADALVAVAVLAVVYQLRSWWPGGFVDNGFKPEMAWAPTALYAIVWVVLLYLEGEYRLRARWTLHGEVSGVARATLWLGLLTTAALFMANFDDVSRGLVLLLFPVQFLATLATRGALRWGFMYLRERGRNSRMMLILGTSAHAIRFAHEVEDHSALGIRVIGFVGDQPPATRQRWPYLGTIDQVTRILHQEVVDEVAVCVPASEWPQVQQIAELCTEEGKIVRIPLDVPHMGPEMRIIEDMDGTPVLSLVQGPDQAMALALKRLFDVVVSALALVLLSPVLLGIALYVRRQGGGPVLFRQTRVGMHGRQFTMLKFRTMIADAEARYPELADLSDTRGFKLQDDPRVAPWGAALRRSSLDELPQLLNVLRGDMSIVGPRPAPPREVHNYDLWHRRRLSMKPGMTGLWQVGPRYDRDFNERARLDLDYIDRWSLWLDLRIMLRTLPAVLHLTGR